MTDVPPLMDEVAYRQGLPKKRMASGALFFFQGKVLIVKPTYRDYWLIPGGVVEKSESPKQSCEREVFEEIGLRISLGPLLAVDYRNDGEGMGDSLQFLFDGGELSAAQVDEIRLQKGELSEFKFSSPEEAFSLLETRLSRRVQICWEGYGRRSGLYLEDGEWV